MSLIKIFRSYAVLLLVFVHQLAMAQTETPATVPSSLTGTYDLTFTMTSAGGPFSNGQSVTVVFGVDNTLCIEGKTLTSPVLRNGNPHEATWADSSANLEYSLSSLVSGFNEVNVFGPNSSPFYGQLKGSKTSDATSCSSAPAPVVTASMVDIFELAESKLAEFFPSGAVTQFLDNYVYRFYEATGVYLAFADGNVFLLGGGFGEAVVNAGSISSVLTALDVYEVSGGGTGSVDLWNLSISGTVTVLGNAVSFAAINLADIPAPDLGDTNAISQEINSTLAGVATGISSISITVVNNSSSQRTFDVEFNATTAAGSVSYNLRYDYTR